MHKTHIEYGVNSDGSKGFSWPIFTGCGQPLSVCLTRAQCWARTLHHRFGKTGWAKLYNADFSLRFNEDLLDEPLWIRSPSKILVAFTGDMFGPGSENYWSAQERVLGRVWRLPQHTFIFLTKSPEYLARLNPWPPNALVGASITGAETLERQHAMIAQLARVEGGKRWISYEPVLGPFLGVALLVNVDWLVIGAQSGAGAVQPKLEWVLDIIEAARTSRVPLLIKKNLSTIYPKLEEWQWRGERCVV